MLTSIKTLLKIGPGPSSSHTIGPFKAAKDFITLINNKAVSYIEVTLYASLALTGRGHFTDKIILDTLSDYQTKVIFDINTRVSHPNTMVFKAYDKNKKVLVSKKYLSIGGGEIKSDDEKDKVNKQVYPFEDFSSLVKYLDENKMTIREVVKKFDESDIVEYVEEIYSQMISTLKLGLVSKGEVADKLHVKRVAQEIFLKAQECKDEEERQILYLSSFAYAVSECNAAGEMIVTAPTCGSSGIIPSVLYYSEFIQNKPHDKIIDGLMMAGLIGLIIRHNATISGAVGGCQAEVGSACAMAAGALAVVNGLSNYQVEYAAEIGMEHNLGLTCDHVMGYVAIPCIERNSIGALKAYIAYIFSKDIATFRKNTISLDEVIEVMYQTGLSLSKDYKETSKGGLASIHKEVKHAS